MDPSRTERLWEIRLTGCRTTEVDCTNILHGLSVSCSFCAWLTALDMAAVTGAGYRFTDLDIPNIPRSGSVDSFNTVTMTTLDKAAAKRCEPSRPVWLGGANKLVLLWDKISGLLRISFSPFASITCRELGNKELYHYSHATHCRYDLEWNWCRPEAQDKATAWRRLIFTEEYCRFKVRIHYHQHQPI